MKAVNYFLKSFILDVRQGFEYVFYRDVLWQVFFCELCKCFRISFSKNTNAELSLTLLRLGFLKVFFWGGLNLAPRPPFIFQEELIQY